MTTTNVLAGTQGKVDRKNQEKLYIQIMRLLVDDIGRGTWGIGDRIPSEDELAARFGVSKITIRQALSNLSADGYLMKVQGRGTFVAGNKPVVGLTMKTGFTDGLFGRGVQETREVLERGVLTHRRRSDAAGDRRADLPDRHPPTGGRGAGLCRTSPSSPPGLLPGIEAQDLGGFVLFAAIQERGTRKVFKMRQTVEITTLTAREADTLGAAAGKPVLAVHRLLIGAEDQPLAYSRIVEIGERFKLETEFERIR